MATAVKEVSVNRCFSKKLGWVTSWVRVGNLVPLRYLAGESCKTDDLRLYCEIDFSRRAKSLRWRAERYLMTLVEATLVGVFFIFLGSTGEVAFFGESFLGLDLVKESGRFLVYPAMAR